MAQQFAPPICARIRATRERLRDEAQARGGREAASEFSQEKVAQRVGVSLGAYRKWEIDREPNYARRLQIARALGLDEKYFEATENPEVQALREEVADVRGQLDEVLELLRGAKLPGARRRRSA